MKNNSQYYQSHSSDVYPILYFVDSFLKLEPSVFPDSQHAPYVAAIVYQLSGRRLEYRRHSTLFYTLCVNGMSYLNKKSRIQRMLFKYKNVFAQPDVSSKENPQDF